MLQTWSFSWSSDRSKPLEHQICQHLFITIDDCCPWHFAWLCRDRTLHSGLKPSDDDHSMNYYTLYIYRTLTYSTQLSSKRLPWIEDLLWARQCASLPHDFGIYLILCQPNQLACLDISDLLNIQSGIPNDLVHITFRLLCRYHIYQVTRRLGVSPSDCCMTFSTWGNHERHGWWQYQIWQPVNHDSFLLLAVVSRDLISFVCQRSIPPTVTIQDLRVASREFSTTISKQPHAQAEAGVDSTSTNHTFG